jgi:hypothetical protein
MQPENQAAIEQKCPCGSECAKCKHFENVGVQLHEFMKFWEDIKADIQALCLSQNIDLTNTKATNP